MIGGSSFLKKEIYSYLMEVEQEFVSEMVGFLNFVVDWIVLIQYYEDLFKVLVELFFEWVIDELGFKGKMLVINGVLFVDDLMLYIEWKLFMVNIGYVVIVYVGYQCGFKMVKEVIDYLEICCVVYLVLFEIGDYFIKMYGFK